MFPLVPWIYIIVPAVIISMLVLIKLRQEKTGNYFYGSAVEDEGTTKGEQSGTQPRASVKIKEVRQKASDKERPHNCLHYLGYLYMRKGPNSAYIPNECYGCQKLLQCMYSPNVIDKVYGE